LLKQGARQEIVDRRGRIAEILNRTPSTAMIRRWSAQAERRRHVLAGIAMLVGFQEILTVSNPLAWPGEHQAMEHQAILCRRAIGQRS
jgi:hypothetical protein